MKQFSHYLAESAQQITTHLDQQIAAFEKMGHPCVMERFVKRNGKAYDGAKFSGKRGPKKMCFMNAAKLTWESSDLHYVEGYVMIPGIPLLIHHAWCVTADGAVVDPTIDKPEKHSYFGVTIDANKLGRQLAKLGHYGLLDTPTGINVDFMFAEDPSLKAEVERVLKTRSTDTFRM